MGVGRFVASDRSSYVRFDLRFWGFEGVRVLDRKKLGLLAVTFVLVIGVMEVLALRIGSFDFPVPSSSQHPAIADHPGES